MATPTVQREPFFLFPLVIIYYYISCAANKSKTSSTTTNKTLSAPNSIIDLSQHAANNSSPSPTHKNSRSVKRQGESKASPPVSERSGGIPRNSSAHSFLPTQGEGQSSKTVGVVKFKDGGSGSSSTATATGSSGKRYEYNY